MGGKVRSFVPTPTKVVPHTIVAGDQVRPTVREDDSFAGRYAVSERGIGVANVGRINIVGMTPDLAADKIARVLEATQLSTATVTVRRVNKAANRGGASQATIIYLAGEFSKPGSLRIPTKAVPTLLQTLIRSGGITPSGDLTRVKMLRVLEGAGGNVSEINVAAILSGETKSTDILLRDGDIIVIPPFTR